MKALKSLTVGNVKSASDNAREQIAKDVTDAVMPYFKKSEKHINDLTNDINTLIQNQDDFNARLEKLEKQCKK
jgi:uncharacterized protein YhaN